MRIREKKAAVAVVAVIRQAIKMRNSLSRKVRRREKGEKPGKVYKSVHSSSWKKLMLPVWTRLSRG
jgi:hypothetical protein